jgi:anthranilate phosphoribosyltransferase
MADFTPYPWSDLLGTLAAGEDLSEERSHAAMTEIMAGRATHAQIAGMILAMRIKGETIDEIVGLVRAMREAAVPIDVDEPVIVDTAGTGGDRSGTFNISTTSAFIAAGAGVRVAKHGNRAASSLSGSADLLEGLGVVIDLPPAATATLLREAGFAFFFAPTYHPAMRHAAPVRTQLGVPTVFNFLGPLANPAGSRHQTVGVSDATMAGKMIGALQRLGAEYAFVYYGEDGLDEITTVGPSFIYRLRDDEITHAEFTPEDFGVPRARAEDLRGGTIQENVAICRDILGGKPGPKRDIAVVNAAPAIVVAGLASGFEEAVHTAAASIDSGSAAAVLDRVVERSRQLASDG